RHTRFDCDWSSDVCSSDLRCARPALSAADARRQELKRFGFAIVCRRVHIAKCEHVFEPIFAPTLETAFPRRPARIVQCAEKPVPNRQVGEVLRMMPILVMNAMRFGPLDEMADPTRRLDVPMIKEFSDCGQA